MPGSFAFRIGLVIAGIVTAAALLTATLNYFKFQRAIERQEASLHAFIVEDLVSSVENGMDLGLGLADLGNIERLIEARRARNGDVLSIEIFDGAGRVVHRTGDDAARPGELPELAARAMAEDHWFDIAPDAYSVGQSIHASYGAVIGGLVLRYDREATRRRNATVLFSLARTTLVAALTGSLAALLGVSLISRLRRRRLQDLSARLTVAAGEEGRLAEDAATDPIEAATRDAYAKLTAAERALGELGPSA